MPRIVATASPQDKPKLLDQVRDVIRREHYSIRTEQAYVDWRVKASLTRQGLNAIFDPTKCGKRHPSAMAESEVTEFLTHLARAGRVAASTQNQHVKASLTCRERL